MIHFISRYFYTVQRNKVEMLSASDRRRLVLTCIITAVITITIILWLLY